MVGDANFSSISTRIIPKLQCSYLYFPLNKDIRCLPTSHRVGNLCSTRRRQHQLKEQEVSAPHFAMEPHVREGEASPCLRPLRPSKNDC